MKTLTTILLAVTILSSTQCKSPTETQKAVMIIDVSVPSAVRYALARKPTLRGSLTFFAELLDRMATDGMLAPSDLQVAVSSFKQHAGQLNDPNVSMIADGVIDVVVSIYNQQFASTVLANVNEHNLASVLKAMAAAIRRSAS